MTQNIRTQRGVMILVEIISFIFTIFVFAVLTYLCFYVIDTFFGSSYTIQLSLKFSIIISIVLAGTVRLVREL